MPPIEDLRVHAVELAHGFGQISVGGFKKQVEVIGHQTVGVTEHIEPAERLPEDGQERIPVDVIGKDRSLGVAAGRHVIDGSRKFYAEGSGHERERARNESRFKI
jgi:hypothetical protein